MFRCFGGLASELKGEILPLGESMLSHTGREPIGVVCAITLWKAPLLLAGVKIAPALCAGNTIVLKAAGDAPLAVLLLAEICQDRLPLGVLNVLTGFGEECGGQLSHHPEVRKLSLTGSTAVGKIMMQTVGDRRSRFARAGREEPVGRVPAPSALGPVCPHAVEHGGHPDVRAGSSAPVPCESGPRCFAGGFRKALVSLLEA